LMGERLGKKGNQVPTLKNLSRIQVAESSLLPTEAPNHHLTMGNWVVNHWFSVLFLAAWLGLNVFLFYYYTRQILGSALSWARASILLPVCRNLLSFLRGTCSLSPSHLRTLGKQLDHNLTFHKLVAYITCLHTAIHITTHLFNFERYSRSRQATDGSLASILSNLSHQEKDSWLNPIQSSNTTMEYVTFTYTAGVTGVIITIALVLMVTLAMEFIQRSYSAVFWYTHHIFIMYFIGLGIHGLGGLVRDQTEKNMDENHPHKCAEFLEKWSDPDSHCKPPQFERLPAESRKWILTPVIIYIFERILRFYRSQQKVVITKVKNMHFLLMHKHGFSMEVGQYIFVNCPSISYLEWHPFTLTSNSPVPRIKVNGPFGTVSEDVFQYEVAVLVRAGIGVTPFASILKSIWYKFQNADHNLKTQTIYFYWIYRETGAFAWFSDLLVSLEQEMEKLGKVGFLNYRLFLTGWDCNFAGHAALSFDKATDILTGLKQKTSFGRPMWDNEFSTIATAHPKSAVGVFLCGPQTLAKSLRKCCHQYSSLDPRKVQFYFNNENF
uniref:NADPH oxidase 1 n=1 Tax=Balaenoptera musculus TaxID=9771 RepID=A0A8C0DYA1_BALMU